MYDAHRKSWLASHLVSAISLFLLLLPNTARALQQQGRSAADRPATQTASWREVLNSIDAALKAGRPDREYGTLDGDSTGTFGRLGTFEVLPDGGIRVIDDQAVTVTAISAGATSYRRVGRRGGGPGEYRVPVGVLTDAEGDVHVLDLRQGRISRYRNTSGAFEFVSSVQADTADAFCIVEGTYYIVNPHGPNVLSRLGPNGDRLTGFGETTGYVDPSLFPGANAADYRFRQDKAHLYCDAARDIIMLAHHSTPTVRAFTRHGKPLWRTTLRDYRQGGFAPVRGRPGSYVQTGDAKTGTMHSTTVVFPVVDGVIALSMLEQPVLRRAGTKYELRLLSVQNGRELRKIMTPERVVGLTRTHVYTYSDDPYPRIMAHRLNNE